MLYLLLKILKKTKSMVSIQNHHVVSYMVINLLISKLMVIIKHGIQCQHKIVNMKKL